MRFKLIQHLNDDDKNKNDMFDDFNFFEKKIKKFFDVFNEKQTTKQII